MSHSDFNMELDRGKLTNYLMKIRVIMDSDQKKAKQMLTNLITNINKEQGSLFKVIKYGSF